MKKQTIILSCLWVAVLLVPFVVLGDTAVAPVATPEDAVAKTISSITTWIMGISLGVAVLMYAIGGYFFIIDNGNLESVKMAKNIIISATVGLAIIIIANSLVSIIKTLVKTS